MITNILIDTTMYLIGPHSINFLIESMKKLNPDFISFCEGTR